MPPSIVHLWSGLVRLFLWLLAILLALSAIIAGVAACLAWWWDRAWLHPGNWYLGLVCGLIAFLFAALFHFRRETWTFPCKQPARFLDQVRGPLEEMGYELHSREGFVVLARPRFHALLLGSALTIDAGFGEAKITGPRLILERLRKYMRVQVHLDCAKQSSREIRRPKTGPLLKRVELTMRFSAQQFDLVRSHVVEPLQREAEVVCDLHLLAQSEHGVSDHLLEYQIRTFLQKHEIDADIAKNHVQLAKV